MSDGHARFLCILVTLREDILLESVGVWGHLRKIRREGQETERHCWMLDAGKEIALTPQFLPAQVIPSVSVKYHSSLEPVDWVPYYTGVPEKSYVGNVGND